MDFHKVSLNDHSCMERRKLWSIMINVRFESGGNIACRTGMAGAGGMADLPPPEGEARQSGPAAELLPGLGARNGRNPHGCGSARISLVVAQKLRPYRLYGRLARISRMVNFRPLC